MASDIAMAAAAAFLAGLAFGTITAVVMIRRKGRLPISVGSRDYFVDSVRYLSGLSLRRPASHSDGR